MQPQRSHPRPATTHGHTLPKLLVVLLIISLLAAIALSINLRQPRKAREAQLQIDIWRIRQDIDAYHQLHGAWPPDTEPGVAPDGVTFPERDGVIFDWDNFKVGSLCWGKVLATHGDRHDNYLAPTLPNVWVKNDGDVVLTVFLERC